MMHKMIELKRWWIAALAVLLIAVAAAPLFRAQAGVSLDYELLGTHPEAAAQPTERGRTLHTLEYFNDKIYAGYGDYDANTGPVDINPFDLSTSDFTGSELSIPTEEINQLRTINGKLYAPAIDPQGGPVTTGGYGVGEPWANNMNIPNTIHNFDMATLTGTDLWVVGSGETEEIDGAVAWRSTDGGSTWDIARYDNGGDRYYWIANLNGKVYMQMGNLPVRIFDGITWTDGTTQEVAEANGKVVVFKDQIIGIKGGLTSYNGTTVTKMLSFTGTARNMYVDGDYLYVVRWDGTLTRSSDLLGWQELEAPDNASSVAVHDGTVYIGTTDSKLYASTEPIPGVPPSVTMTEPSAGTVSGTVNIAVQPTSSSPVTNVTYKIGGITLQTYNSQTYSYAWDTKGVLNGTYQLYVQVQNQDGSTAMTEPVTVMVNNPKPTPPPTPTPTPTPVPSSQSKTKQATTAHSTRTQIASTQSQAAQQTGPAPSEEQATEEGDVEAVNPSAPVGVQKKQESTVKKVEKEAENNKPLFIAGGIALFAGIGFAVFWIFRPKH